MKKLIFIITSVVATLSIAAIIDRNTERKGGSVQDFKDTIREMETASLRETEEIPRTFKLSNEDQNIKWKRDIDRCSCTVTVHVATSRAHPFGAPAPIYRNLVFDADGRLVEISPAFKQKREDDRRWPTDDLVNHQYKDHGSGFITGRMIQKARLEQIQKRINAAGSTSQSQCTQDPSK